jgi:hypothetical protein
MAYAEGGTAAGLRTFHEIIVSLTGDLNWFMCGCDTAYTYIFELVSPESRVVKQYGAPALYMLGIRSNVTGGYLPEDVVDAHAVAAGVLRPARYTFSTIEDCLTSMAALPLTDEGYVACFGEWRIKIKNPAYLAIAHLRNNGAVSPPRVLYLVMTGEVDEYLAVFPEDAPLFTGCIAKRARLLQELPALYETVKDIADQKEYALAVKDTPYGPYLFRMRKHGLSAAQILSDLARQGADGKASQALVSLFDRIPEG